MQQLTRRYQADEVSTQRLLRNITAIGPASSSGNGDETEDGYTIARLLYETAQLLRDWYERQLRDRVPDLTLAQCTVLMHLAQYEGANQTALAKILDIRPSTLVRLLDRLEAAGFVTRMPDPLDRRAHLLVLTAKARPIIASVYRVVRISYGDRQLGISKAEVNQLQAALYRIQLSLIDKRIAET